MNRLRLSILGLIIANSTLCGAQNTEAESVKSLEIWFGLENRITPIYTNNQNGQIIQDYYLPVNIDKQLSGTGVSIGIAYLLPKINTYVAFEYAARYDHLYYSSGIANTNTESINGIISDYHFRVGKPFSLKEITLTPGFGFSLMNHGTEYRINHNSFWVEDDLNFNSLDLSIGLGINKMDFELRTYFINNNKYDYDTGNIILPEIKIKYRISVR
jgi:hypothetical protein